MTQPTDADRQRAQDVGREIRKHLFSSRHPNTGAVELGLSWEANDIIASAIAAARTEALEKAADFVLDNTYTHSTHPPFHLVVRCTDMHGPSVVNRTLAAAIRALKEPTHGG